MSLPYVWYELAHPLSLSCNNLPPNFPQLFSKLSPTPLCNGQQVCCPSLYITGMSDPCPDFSSFAISSTSSVQWSSSISHKNKWPATAKVHQDSTAKLSNAIDDDEEDKVDHDDEESEEDEDDGKEDNDGSVKVQAALANTATAKKQKEKTAKEAEEWVAKEAEKSMEGEEVRWQPKGMKKVNW
ncbi:hypothetical protein ARMGADRAFT_1040121 [Armillaria gallica]|uniref:Uncharacterized protein n=1 Tax=Armillaria gallica TaxID=47427 RepID=A0A2H3CMG5_ARMGA|nr:hypothetical protein ARMGADRAFT_1040121 [Armillaria gallica]